MYQAGVFMYRKGVSMYLKECPPIITLYLNHIHSFIHPSTYIHTLRSTPYKYIQIINRISLSLSLSCHAMDFKGCFDF